MSTRAEVVEEGAKVSRNYHVVIVFMWNLWNVTKEFPCHCKSTKFFPCFLQKLWEGSSPNLCWAVLNNRYFRPWLNDVFRQPYTLHVLDLPCTQLSLTECSSLNATRWNSNLAVTPTELNLGLLASTTTSELQPPGNPLCVLQKSSWTVAHPPGRACGNMAETYYPIVDCTQRRTLRQTLLILG